MSKYSKVVHKVIEASDIVLIVIDARHLAQSSNRGIAATIHKLGKKHIFVINKVDLLPDNELEKIDMQDSVKVSATKRIGTLRLFKKILELARGKEVTVGIVGYPNTGKSAIVNALKGHHSAPTSSVSGYTKGAQRFALNDKIMLIDTPGVIEYKDADETALHMMGALNIGKDPECDAMDIIDRMDGKVEKYFSVARHADSCETLEDIARAKNLLMKGGLPDIVRAARQVIMLVQNGKIR